MPTKIRLGISTCPNDTYTFHALLNRLVDWRGLEFEVALLDIQQLNEGLFAGEFDLAKCSFHAALHLADQTTVMPCGSALGYGVGPLLLSARDGEMPSRSEQVTLCPGEHTTAAMLFELFYGGTTRVEHIVFSEIMPMLQRQESDFGVCIHEGRFTWQQENLGLVVDLGEMWETQFSCPLPLGGLVASRDLDPLIIETANEVIRESLHYAHEHPQQALLSMRHYAQEFEDDVLFRHVELYVNDWTEDLGAIGSAALSELSRQSKRAGLVPEGRRDLEVFSGRQR